MPVSEGAISPQGQGASSSSPVSEGPEAKSVAEILLNPSTVREIFEALPPEMVEEITKHMPRELLCYIVSSPSYKHQSKVHGSDELKNVLENGKTFAFFVLEDSSGPHFKIEDVYPQSQQSIPGKHTFAGNWLSDTFPLLMIEGVPSIQRWIGDLSTSLLSVSHLDGTYPRAVALSRLRCNEFASVAILQESVNCDMYDDVSRLMRDMFPEYGGRDLLTKWVRVSSDVLEMKAGKIVLRRETSSRIYPQTLLASMKMINQYQHYLTLITEVGFGLHGKWDHDIIDGGLHTSLSQEEQTICETLAIQEERDEKPKEPSFFGTQGVVGKWLKPLMSGEEKTERNKLMDYMELMKETSRFLKGQTINGIGGTRHAMVFLSLSPPSETTLAGVFSVTMKMKLYIYNGLLPL